MGSDGERRRERLGRASLYLVCGPESAGLLPGVLAAGVDIVQLRAKDATEARVLEAAEVFRRCADDAGALFVLNDRPDLAVSAGADGVHLGQDDMAVDRARSVVGSERLIGLSTHGPAQLDAAEGVDYIAVGPVHATPTKPGRPAIGLEPVRYAAEHARIPWFAIGGLHGGNIGDAIAAGAQRVVVVRAITEASDPALAARALRAALDRREATVGTA
jgi:thiamine-phosphate pyrophosphorylase